ncbi:hypothetical protein [Streptomyces sp. NBC_00829]|uniref:hypothetical protein n=1 Tax=Streptomyces sp. NBC_00829 TaxID=2903679 RepID=UPI00386F4C30|nr:hypothetical protein OG293_24430 [Streptomyces sp. NBC_00829]
MIVLVMPLPWGHQRPQGIPCHPDLQTQLQLIRLTIRFRKRQGVLERTDELQERSSHTARHLPLVSSTLRAGKSRCSCSQKAFDALNVTEGDLPGIAQRMTL